MRERMRLIGLRDALRLARRSIRDALSRGFKFYAAIGVRGASTAAVRKDYFGMSLNRAGAPFPNEVSFPIGASASGA